MSQLAPMQFSSTTTVPHLMLQVFTQLQVLKAENNVPWKQCNTTVEDLTKQIHKFQKERIRWREIEQEFNDEKNAFQLRLQTAVETIEDLEITLRQHRHPTIVVIEATRVLQKELQEALNDVDKYRSIATNKGEEVSKANKYVQEMEQELNASREESELCNILASTAIETEENEDRQNINVANNTVLRLRQALVAVKRLENSRNEITTMSKILEEAIYEKNELLQQNANEFSRMTEAKNQMSEEINKKENEITSLLEEKQKLLRQLEEEKDRNNNLQNELVEKNKLSCIVLKELPNIKNQPILDEALLDAARRGNVRDIKILLHMGASLNARDHWYLTPLTLTVMENHTEAMSYLYQKTLESRHPHFFRNL